MLHGVLFCATLTTLLATGFLFWAGSTPEPARAGREALVYAGWVAMILLAHEFGHYLACRYYGVPATLPFFIPGIPPIGTFGALIRVRGRIPHRRALFDIAAAGPIAGFLVALPALVVGLRAAQPFEPQGAGGVVYHFGRPVAVALLRPWLLGGSYEITANAAYGAGWVGMLVTSLNLFPVGQLDGGHATYAVSARLHRLFSRLVPIALGAMLAGQALRGEFTPAYLLWIAILLWMRDRHPPLLDPGLPLGGGRKLVAVLLGLLFVLSFMAMPIQVFDL